MLTEIAELAIYVSLLVADVILRVFVAPLDTFFAAILNSLVRMPMAYLERMASYGSELSSGNDRPSPLWSVTAIIGRIASYVVLAINVFEIALSYLFSTAKRFQHGNPATDKSSSITTQMALRPMHSEFEATDRDRYEQAQWVNTLLEQSWPQIAKCTVEKARATLEPLLQQAKPSCVSSLEISVLDLGTKPPIIHAIRCHQQYHHTLGRGQGQSQRPRFRVPDAAHSHLEVDFAWVSDSKACLSIVHYLGAVTELQVRNAEIRGTAHVILGPPVVDIPPFRSARVDFTTKPDIKLFLTLSHHSRRQHHKRASSDPFTGGSSWPLAADESAPARSPVYDRARKRFNVNLGITETLESVIKEQLQSLALYPRFIDFPLSTSVPAMPPTPTPVSK
jgi:hypothetical protein